MQNSTRGETSHLIHLISRNELNENSNTEDANIIFSCLTDILEILGLKNNIIDKTVAILAVFKKYFSSPNS